MKSRIPAFVLVAAGAILAAGYKEVPPPEKVVLPKPMSPAESLAAIKVPDGLEVELVAAEPLVKDPIDVSWGPDGKMWVVEMADYPLGIDGKGKPGGRVRFLESTRGDGHYDKSTLFVDGLRAPTSVVPWKDGVLITSIPDIWFMADTDGDGQADRKEKLFTGLGEGNEQHLENGLQWSLDGWLVMANGNSGGKIVSTRGGVAIELGSRDFRIRPDDGAIELLAGATQYGRNRDDWGNWFGCNNSNPIWHYALEDHYLRRNPHLTPPNATVSVASIPGAAPVFPRSETLARFNDPNGFNHFTSACGVMIYRDDFLGREYAGNVFVCEPVHNLVHREIVHPAGATFKSERAPSEQASEFFASKDNWSRFSSVRAGPDGALYIVDMYRMVIEHPKWIPDAWQKELGNMRQGENEGRIYRVKPKGVALRPVPRLDQAKTEALVKALDNPSGVVRDWAMEQLVWRGDKSAAAGLEQLVTGATRPETRVEALCTLPLIGALTPVVVTVALNDSHPGVRRQAVRLSEAFAATEPSLLNAVLKRVEDGSASVLQQVAYTLGEWKQREAGLGLVRLLRPDEDRFVRAAAMSSVLPHAETVVAELRRTGSGSDPLLIEVATAAENAQALAGILQSIARPDNRESAAPRFAAMATLLDWLQRNNKTLTQLQATGGKPMTDALTAADKIFDDARSVAGNARARLGERIAAAKILGRGRTRQSEDVELLGSLLTPQVPVDLELAAAGALGRVNRNNVPDKLLAGWAGYSGAVRSAVLELVTSRPAWINALLDRLEANPAMVVQIEPGRRVALTQHSNQKVAERASALFNASIDQNRQKVIDRYLASAASLRGDAAKGAVVFTSVCTACHKFGQVGDRTIGPDLASVKDRSAPYLITHILDPNRAVEEKYVLYTANTQDGRTLAGMLAGEAGNSITLIGLDGAEQTILRSELRSLASTTRSVMPDGLEASINEQAMMDLVAYLAGEK